MANNRHHNGTAFPPMPLLHGAWLLLMHPSYDLRTHVRGGIVDASGNIKFECQSTKGNERGMDAGSQSLCSSHVMTNFSFRGSTHPASSTQPSERPTRHLVHPRAV